VSARPDPGPVGGYRDSAAGGAPRHASAPARHETDFVTASARMNMLHSRRAAARRSARDARIDVALGVVLALLVVLAAPGLAVVAILVLAVLAVCGVSLLVSWIRRRRGSGPACDRGRRARGPTPPAL